LPRGWTALLVAELPGDNLVLLVDDQVVEVVLEWDEVEGHLAGLLGRATGLPR
jgi:hypothetical protein